MSLAPRLAHAYLLADDIRVITLVHIHKRNMKEILVGGVRATVIGDEKCRSTAHTTLVVLVHGRNSSKSATTRFAEGLLDTCNDIVCIVFDLPNHGARLVDSSANKSWKSGNTHHMQTMMALIDQGAAEASTLLQYAPFYLSDLRITHKVLVGTSLGGYIAWKVAAFNPDLISAVVPVITSPNLLSVFTRRWKQYRESNSWEAAEIEASAFPPVLLEDLAALAKKVARIRKHYLPVLAICGADDPLVSPQDTAEWVGGAQINQRAEFFPGVKHEVTRGMIDLTAEYILGVQTAS